METSAAFLSSSKTAGVRKPWILEIGASADFLVGNMVNAVSKTKTFQTTKLPKGTKGSDNHNFKLRVPFDLAQGMLRASFENTRLGMRTKRPAWVPSYPRKRVSRLIRRNKPGFPRARE